MPPARPATGAGVLAAHEGISVASPKASLRALGEVGLLDARQTMAALAMCDDRDSTVHVYGEEVVSLPGHPVDCGIGEAT